MKCASKLPHAGGLLVLEGPQNTLVTLELLKKDRNWKRLSSDALYIPGISVPTTTAFSRHEDLLRALGNAIIGNKAAGYSTVLEVQPNDRDQLHLILETLVNTDIPYIHGLVYTPFQNLSQMEAQPQSILHSMADFGLMFYGNPNKTNDAVGYLTRSDLLKTIEVIEKKLNHPESSRRQSDLLKRTLQHSLQLDDYEGIYLIPRGAPKVVVSSVSPSKAVNTLLSHLSKGRTTLGGFSIQPSIGKKICENCEQSKRLNGTRLSSLPLCPNCIHLLGTDLKTTSKNTNFTPPPRRPAPPPITCDVPGPSCHKAEYYLNHEGCNAIVQQRGLPCPNATSEDRRTYLWAYERNQHQDCGRPCAFPSARNEVRGFCYSPYRTKDGDDIIPCAPDIAQDLTLMESMGCRFIRTYGVSKGLDKVALMAAGRGIKPWIGCNLHKSQHEAKEEVLKALDIADKANSDVVIVGTLVLSQKREEGDDTMQSYWKLSNGMLVVSNLATLFEVARRRKSADVRLAYSDFSEAFLDPSHKDCLDRIDILLVNVLPFSKDLDTNSPDWPVKWSDYVLGEVYKVKLRWPTKEIYIGEVGQPTIGPKGQQIQRTFYEALLPLLERQNLFGFIMEGFDNPWRDSARDSNGSGPHWGAWTVDRQPKTSVPIITKWMRGKLRNCEQPDLKCLEFIDDVRNFKYNDDTEYYTSRGLVLNDTTRGCDGKLDPNAIQVWANVWENNPQGYPKCPLPCKDTPEGQCTNINSPIPSMPPLEPSPKPPTVPPPPVEEEPEPVCNSHPQNVIIYQPITVSEGCQVIRGPAIVSHTLPPHPPPPPELPACPPIQTEPVAEPTHAVCSTAPIVATSPPTTIPVTVPPTEAPTHQPVLLAYAPTTVPAPTTIPITPITPTSYITMSPTTIPITVSPTTIPATIPPTEPPLPLHKSCAVPSPVEDRSCLIPIPTHAPLATEIPQSTLPAAPPTLTPTHTPPPPQHKSRQLKHTSTSVPKPTEPACPCNPQPPQLPCLPMDAPAPSYVKGRPYAVVLPARNLPLNMTKPPPVVLQPLTNLPSMEITSPPTILVPVSTTAPPTTVEPPPTSAPIVVEVATGPPPIIVSRSHTTSEAGTESNPGSSNSPCPTLQCHCPSNTLPSVPDIGNHPSPTNGAGQELSSTASPIQSTTSHQIQSTEISNHIQSEGIPNQTNKQLQINNNNSEATSNKCIRQSPIPCAPAPQCGCAKPTDGGIKSRGNPMCFKYTPTFHCDNWEFEGWSGPHQAQCV